MFIYLKGGERNVHPLFLQDGERIVQSPKNSYIPYPLPIFPNSYMLNNVISMKIKKRLRVALKGLARRPKGKPTLIKM